MDEHKKDSQHSPNPDDIQKEFEDFVKKRFGDSVQVFTGAMPQHEDASQEQDEEEDFELTFDRTPKEVKQHLDKYIIQQDEAKRALAIAICDHYNHIKRCHQAAQNDFETVAEYAKQNVMILGPTGVGKTYMVRKIAELIGVPFVKADATRFSETGYVGANVDDLVRDLVTQADGNIKKAQYGIVYLDEVDKLANSQNSGGRDVTGRGVQFGLLRLMEDADVDLKSGNDVQSQIRAMMEFQSGKKKPSIINTKNILFIVSGAFTDLEGIIKKRLNTNAIGFGAKAKFADEVNLLKNATTQDLIDFGFEPEFIGRLPVKVACNHLDENDLYDILKNAKGSIVNQYISAFNAYGIDANFTDEALLAIAQKASVEKTGARSLMTVTESLLRNYKFELPGSHIVRLDVTKELIADPEGYLQKVLELPDQRELNLRLRDILAYEKSFANQYGITINFSQETAEGIAKKAIQEGRGIPDICDELLSSFEHGLKLIQQSTGRSRFTLEKEILKDPTGLLETMIASAFQERSHQTHNRR